MSREQDDRNSIWASRTSPDSFSSTFGFSAPQRRARAGTLPSRLPSRLPPRLDTSTLSLDQDNGAPPLSHLGSLALISPGGNDIVYDSFPPSSRSAVGQQPGERRRSPPLEPILEPSSAAETFEESKKSSTDSSSSGRQTNGGDNAATSGSAISSSVGNGETLGVNSRSRAGSMNSVGSRPYPFNPFGNSIWGPGTMTPLASSSTGSSGTSGVTPASSISGALASGTGSSGAAGMPDIDSLSPFGDTLHPGGLRNATLNNSLGATPSRMRSYTTMDAPSVDWSGVGGSLGLGTLGSTSLGGTPLGGGTPLSTPADGPSLHPRSRAHTLLGGSGVQPAPLMSLGRMTGSHPDQQYAASIGDGLGSGVGSLGSGNMSSGLDTIGSNTVQLGDFSSVPTPALYISNVPPHVNSHTLQGIFGNFGRIESAGVIPTQRSAYIVFASTIQAIEAQATANGAELYLANGPSTVSFAQVLSSSPAILGGNSMGHSIGHAVSSNRSSPSRSTRSSPPRDASAVDKTASLMGTTSSTPNATASASGLEVDSSSASPISVAYVLQSLNAPSAEVQSGVAHLKRAATKKFDVPIMPLSEALAGEERVYNAAVLRDLRRRIEPMHQHDIEELALDMQHELPSLASDYIGNTVVQLIFERSSSDVRDMMLRRLVPVFAATGTHKNGTWAVQKMIDLARGPRQYALIEKAIRPHLVSLLLDQFGNYVVQACLKFGAPYNDFVYSGVASSLAKVAPNRFGARAVRALLESEHTTLANQRLVATAIVQQITNLALNTNGCLLVSWLLDGFERVDPSVHAKTHTLVANQLVPRYLATLCSSKIGSGIVIKLASSSSSTSSQRVFDSLLEPLTDDVPAILVEVLEDVSGQGPATIYRLLSSVFPLNSLERQVTVNKVRMCLLRPHAIIPNHKRLLEECGLEMLQATQPASSGFVNGNGSAGSHGSSGSHGNIPTVSGATAIPTPIGSLNQGASLSSSAPLSSTAPIAVPSSGHLSDGNPGSNSTSPEAMLSSPPDPQFASTGSSSTSLNTLGSDHLHHHHGHSHHHQRHHHPARQTSSPSPDTAGQTSSNNSSNNNPLMMHAGVPVRYTH